MFWPRGGDIRMCEEMVREGCHAPGQAGRLVLAEQVQGSSGFPWEGHWRVQGRDWSKGRLKQQERMG